MTLDMKVSGTGFLCAKHEGEWLVLFQLTEEQLNEWRWLEFLLRKKGLPSEDAESWCCLCNARHTLAAPCRYAPTVTPAQK
jgi:hypothetical protein